MRKINLKGISEILSEKELKNVMGGSGGVILGNCQKGVDEPDPYICRTIYGNCSSCIKTSGTYQCYLQDGLNSINC